MHFSCRVCNSRNKSKSNVLFHVHLFNIFDAISSKIHVKKPCFSVFLPITVQEKHTPFPIHTNCHENKVSVKIMHNAQKH